MIVLDHVSKTFAMRGRRKTVARDICAVFPTGAVIGLLGRNGAGKSTLLNMIAGTVEPSGGRILTDGRISYPVGFAGAFHPELTGAQNTRFVARIYGIDTGELVEFVAAFADLGKHFHLPFRTYSAGMKARLSFGVSMGIPFDFYLIDEVTAVGDAAFREKSQEVFADRMRRAGALFCSHSMPMVRQLCDMGAVLEDGALRLFDDVEAAIRQHVENMTLRPPGA